jgi:hypothetical protein
LSISERDRHRLHTKAGEAMGADAADTLMSYLPPVGWADVATKRDLDALEERMDLRFQLVDQRFDQVDRRFEEVARRFEEVDRRFDSLHDIFATKAELAEQTRTILLGVGALNLTFGGLAVAIVQLMR